MKIVLELPEAYQIIVDHLNSQGRIENKDTSVTLHIDRLGNENPTVNNIRGKKMKLFFCPICGKEQIRSDDPYKNERTIVNVRDGYGTPITHYKCECGNYLAGSMYISDERLVQYYKYIIKGYNKGGCYYSYNSPLSGDNCDLFERAKLCYEKRKEKAKEKSEEKANNLLKEIYWYERCDKNNGDKCEHGHCSYSILCQNQFICGRKSISPIECIKQ